MNLENTSRGCRNCEPRGKGVKMQKGGFFHPDFLVRSSVGSTWGKEQPGERMSGVVRTWGKRATGEVSKGEKIPEESTCPLRTTTESMPQKGLVRKSLERVFCNS